MKNAHKYYTAKIFRTVNSRALITVRVWARNISEAKEQVQVVYAPSYISSIETFEYHDL